MAGQPPEKGGLDLRRWLERTLGVGSALILIAIVLITCVDVVGRYFLNAPLHGAFEMTQVLVAALVFAALPLTTERREHVEVDMVASIIPASLDRKLQIAAGLISAVLLAVFAWQLAIYATQLGHDGTVTNALGIPIAPFAFFASLSCLISAFLAAWRGLVPPTDDHHPRAEETAL